MIFEEKYNNAINLLCNLKKEFKNDFDEAIKLLPNRLSKKCKSRRNFEYYDENILSSFIRENNEMEFVVNGDDLFFKIQMKELNEKTIDHIKEFENVEPLFFALDIEDKSIMYDLDIRKVRNNRFVISVRKDNEYDESEVTYYEIGKKELLEKLNVSYKR